MKPDRRQITLLLFIALWATASFVPKHKEPLTLVVPVGWPKPVVDFKHNKLTRQGFELGRTLFNDPILSKDNSISCASCHLNFTAFTHADHNVSHGIYGLKGTRNSLALFNLAWSNSFMWDGRIKSLLEQPLTPLTSHVEMDSKLEDVVKKLNRSGRYKEMFFAAFGDSIANDRRLLQALAQFTLLLQSYNSKYDSVQRHEASVTFSEAEAHGYQLFKQHCASCHREPLFTNNEFRNNGLALDSNFKDMGRMAITGRPSDSLLFKVPSLRNIASSAPYMHDGRFPRLKDVLEHYTNGVCYSPTLSRELRIKINLSSSDKKELIAFLNTLTDNSFLYDVRFRAQPVY